MISPVRTVLARQIAVGVVPAVQLRFAIREPVDAVIPALGIPADLTSGRQAEQHQDPEATQNSVHRKIHSRGPVGGRDSVPGTIEPSTHRLWHRPTSRWTVPIVGDRTQVPKNRPTRAVKVYATSRRVGCEPLDCQRFLRNRWCDGADRYGLRSAEPPQRFRRNRRQWETEDSCLASHPFRGGNGCITRFMTCFTIPQ